MPKIDNRALKAGEPASFPCQPNVIITYVNRARQIARMGPGLTQLDLPLVALSKGEIDRFTAEIFKTLPEEIIHIVRGSEGVNVYALQVDRAWRPATPTKVDVSKIAGDPQHKRLWEVCQDQADYLAGRDTEDHTKPDCSSGCRYFHKLSGDHGADWGVCTEPRSPRAGLLTFEHMGCQFYEKPKK